MKAYNFRNSNGLHVVGSFLDPVTQINKMTLRRSTNDGGSWSQFTIVSDSNSTGYSVLVNPQDARVIYVGGEKYSSDGNPYAALYKTTDNGVTWNRIGRSVINHQWEQIKVLECDKSNPNKVYAGSSYGLYVSTDAGSTWSQLSMYSAYALVIDPANGNNLFLGSYDGVQLSTDGGKTWRSFNEHLTTSSIECLDYDAVNKVLYAGTRTGGVFRRNLGTASAVQDDATPSRFTLEQNYPNPFNPTTTIRFSVPEQGSYRLTVQTLLGQQVACLVNGTLAAGSYSVPFDGQNLSSGTYFYRLERGTSILTKKMIIIK